MLCFRRLLKITYKDDEISEDVRNKIQDTTGNYDDLLTIVCCICFIIEINLDLLVYRGKLIDE